MSHAETMRNALVSMLVVLVATAASSSSASPARRAPGDAGLGRPRTLDPAVWSGDIVLKLDDDSGAMLTDRRIVDGQGTMLVDLPRCLPAGAVRSVEQGFGIERGALDAARSRAMRKCGCSLADLSTYFTLRVDPGLVSLADALERLGSHPLVAFAYPTPDRRLLRSPADIPPPTPSYVHQQVYLGWAPEGLDVQYAWTLPGGRGEGVSVVDVEVAWDLQHEDLDACADAVLGEVGTPYPWVEQDDIDHGSAVLGILLGGDGEYGVTGFVPDAECHAAPSWTLERGDTLIRAITMSAAHMAGGPGMILIEQQTAGPRYDPGDSSQFGMVPIEWEAAVFDAISLAVADGVAVVEAAGNGQQDLDDAAIYGDWFDRELRDSGAIVVGAGAPYTSSGVLGDRHEPEWFTNHGSRLDLHGWGSAVTTTGYGELFSGDGDVHQYYTWEFSGTSSASATVAGAVAAYLGVVQAHAGETPSPADVRHVLVETGTPQGTGPHIGPQPDLRKALGTIFAVCGDGVVHPDEVCDDANWRGGDGCSADCASDETCGNGILDEAAGEACDDGNDAGGDGCSADCASDETCGNGVRDATLGEVCDDGNTGGGDGCSADCASDETCGNGILDEAAGESCDDGNRVDGDHCSRLCAIEPEPVDGCGCRAAGGAEGPGAALAILLSGLLLLSAAGRRGVRGRGDGRQ